MNKHLRAHEEWKKIHFLVNLTLMTCMKRMEGVNEGYLLLFMHCMEVGWVC